MLDPWKDLDECIGWGLMSLAVCMLALLGFVIVIGTIHALNP